MDGVFFFPSPLNVKLLCSHLNNNRAMSKLEKLVKAAKKEMQKQTVNGAPLSLIVKGAPVGRKWSVSATSPFDQILMDLMMELGRLGIDKIRLKIPRVKVP